MWSMAGERELMEGAERSGRDFESESVQKANGGSYLLCFHSLPSSGGKVTL